MSKSPFYHIASSTIKPWISKHGPADLYFRRQPTDTPVAIIQRNMAFVKLVWINADVESDLRKLPHILSIIIANK